MPRISERKKYIDALTQLVRCRLHRRIMRTMQGAPNVIDDSIDHILHNKLIEALNSRYLFCGNYQKREFNSYRLYYPENSVQRGYMNPPDSILCHSDHLDRGIRQHGEGNKAETSMLKCEGRFVG